MIRTATQADAQGICDIYNWYISKSVATFETEPVTIDDMKQRIIAAQERFFWLVHEDAGRITGYAYASPWKQRAAYFNSVESTVYLHPESTGKGIGKQLYTRLFELLREKKVHVVIGGIALPNDASVFLHEKFGFKKVAHFKEVGFKFDRWVDVGYWQKLV